jgi:hypothetical protein
MFGSAIVDVTIGVVFVYLLLGLVITAGTELMASGLRWRAKSLRAGVQRMLNHALAQEVYDHPMITRLSGSARGPSYIPSETFALVLVDVIANARPADGQPPRNLASLVGNVRDPDVRRVLILLAAEAGADGQRLKENIEKWFNTSMDRVSGWYKRKTQVANVILAVVLTVAVNADSILIVRSLSSDSAVRAALVAQAQAMVRERPAPQTDQPGVASGTSVSDLEARIDKLTSLGVPVGWTDEPDHAYRRWPGWLPEDRGVAVAWAAVWRDTIRYHLLGWLLTALAASLGAPFWFDILKKIITIRSAGKIPEEKLEPARGAPARATGRP